MPLAGFLSPSAHRCSEQMFLSLDGIDGVGKSTQLKLLVQRLQNQGQDVITCREPGGTPLGEAVRELLLNDWNTPMTIVSEMLLYMASRAQLVQEVIRPALQEGKTVIADRYLLASVVYQGYGGGIDTAAGRARPHRGSRPGIPRSFAGRFPGRGGTLSRSDRIDRRARHRRGGGNAGLGCGRKPVRE